MGIPVLGQDLSIPWYLETSYRNGFRNEGIHTHGIERDSRHSGDLERTSRHLRDLEPASDKYKRHYYAHSVRALVDQVSR